MTAYRCGGPKLISSPSTGTGRPCTSSVIGRAQRKDSIVISPAASDRRSMPRRSWSPRSPAPSSVPHSASCQRCATPTITAPGSRFLREDDRAIVRAASAASKAADYLLAFCPESNEPVEAVELSDHLVVSDRQEVSAR